MVLTGSAGEQAEALRVSVRDLFTSIDDAELSSRVESLQARTEHQQAARDRLTGAWRWLYIGIGVVLSLVSFTLGQYGFVLFLAYWTGGYLILVAIRRIYLEPRLEEKYPLSRNKKQLRARRTPWRVSEPAKQEPSPKCDRERAAAAHERVASARPVVPISDPHVNVRSVAAARGTPSAQLAATLARSPDLRLPARYQEPAPGRPTGKVAGAREWRRSVS